ncbi:MAG: Sapep family Mn(2+)-dependent dipeptidase [Clostridia bacterium]|nr:Sapep family Mn(2+)-dependent dipeptidase [Clostridia bacterium]
MINKKYNELLEKWIYENKEDILHKWIELEKIPSIKSAPEDDAPFGINCKDALYKAAFYFEKNGFKTKINDRNTYALCSYGDGERKIGLFSHSDVVPVGDDWIYTEPFNPVIIDGTLIGRGVEDNKSGIMAALCIFRFLKDNGIKLNSKLELFIGSDEECGMGDMKDYLADEKMPEVSLVPDADFPCSIGEKGIYHLMSESKNTFDSIISINGGEAYNIVLDKVNVSLPYSISALDELNGKVRDRSDVTVTADSDYINIQVKGIAKHASIPDGSVNAALVAIELLLDCTFISDNDKAILRGAKEMLSCHYGKGMGVEYNDLVFGKTTCVNGLCKTVDGRLRLSFDIRYGSTQDSAELEKAGDNSLEKYGFIPVEKDNRPGFSIDENSPYPAIFENIYAELTGERLNRVTMSGGTYARKLKNAFSVGTYIIKKDRKSTVFKMPEGHGGAHQCDECIDIEGFFEAVKVLFNYVIACDNIIE